MRGRFRSLSQVSLHGQDQPKLLQRDPDPPAGRQIQREGPAQGGAGLHVAQRAAGSEEEPGGVVVSVHHQLWL